MQNRPGPDEDIDLVHFFIPLEDALAFPDGFTQVLEETATLDDFIDASTRGDSVNIGDTLRWVSVKLWHAEADTSSGVLQAISDTARRAFPTIPETHWTAERPMVPLMIAECAVPLRTDLEDDLAVSEAFDKCLNAVRLIQRAYRATTGFPAALCTREKMPVMLPFARRDNVTADHQGWPDGLEMFLPHDNIYRLARYPDISDSDRELFQHVLEAINDERVFSRFADLRQQVWQLSRRQGEYESSVILAGTATETLLDDLLMSLVWEERTAPADAARLFDSGLETRVKNQFGHRLGGGWHVDRPGAIATWRMDLAALRHRVVHTGMPVRHEEAYGAAQAMEGVFSFVSDRLTRPENVRRWPRTAIGLLGTTRLDELKLLTRRLRDLMAAPDEPDWAATFLRYRIAVAQARRDAAELFEPPDEARSIVFALTQPSGHLSWWLHDRLARHVRRCLPPELPPDQNASFERWMAGIPLDELVEPVTMALFGAHSWALPDSEWLPEYKVLPLEGVMVDRSDLDDLPRILGDTT